MRSGAALKQLNKWADVSCQLDSKKSLLGERATIAY